MNLILWIPREFIGAVGNGISALLGSGTYQVSEIIADSFEYIKWKNRCMILEKVEKCRESSSTARSIPPPDFALPALEAAGSVFDGSLQDLWARLIDGACVQPELAARPFIVAAEQLTPSSASLFDLMASATLQSKDLADTENRFEVFPNDNNLNRDLAILEAAHLIHYDAVVSGGSTVPLLETRILTKFSGGLTRFGTHFYSLISGVPVSEFDSPGWCEPGIGARLSRVEQEQGRQDYFD